jgi:hypothetical protein
MHQESAVDESDVSKSEDADLLVQIKKNIKESRRHFHDWRDQAKEDYDFFSGEQWSDEDKLKLESEGRPAVVFNRIARTINAVIGLEVQNRQEARYFPREMSDAGVNELLSQAAKWVRDNCDAEDEESEAYLDSLVCGMGFTETRLDTQADEETQIIIERRDPFEMGVDHCAKKRNFDDKRFVYRIQKYSRSEFEDQYPDAEIPVSSLFSDDTDGTLQEDSRDAYGQGDQLDMDSRQIEVAQYQYWKLEKFRAVQDVDGSITEMPEERFKKLKPMLDAKNIKYAKNQRKRRVFYQCFLTSAEILEEGPAPCNQFSFHAITGLRDRNKNIWFGLVRLMKDPQRWANKWLSQIQHILNTQAKQGKVLAETGAIKNPRSFAKDWAHPTKPLELNDGGLARVLVHQGSGYPEGIDRLLNYALHAVNDAPGVSTELLGLANRDQPGVLEESRKQAGVTVLAIFFDSLRRYRKEQGRTLASFIQDYISDGRLIRIAGPEGAQYVPLLKDQTAMKYDVVVADAPTSPNMKEKTWAALNMLLPIVMQAGIPIPPDLIDYTPMPVALQEKWKKYISEKSQDPEVAKQKQIAEATQIAEIESKNSAAQLNKAKAMKEMSELQSDPNAELQMQAQQAQQDKAADFELRMLEMQMKREEMTENLRLKREELEATMFLKQQELTASNELKRSDLSMKHQTRQEEITRNAEVATKPQESMSVVMKILDKLNDKMDSGSEAVAQSITKSIDVMGKSIMDSNEKLAEAITAPKVIIEDKDGKAIGVKTGSPKKK